MDEIVVLRASTDSKTDTNFSAHRLMSDSADMSFLYEKDSKRVESRLMTVSFRSYSSDMDEALELQILLSVGMARISLSLSPADFQRWYS